MADVRVAGLSKRFGDVEVLASTDLSIEHGEFVVIVGPSGCGKSTLLRLIAGLEEPTTGRVEIGGRDVTRSPPAERDLAMVFQSYALYPHLTVAQNIGFPLSVAKRPTREIADRVASVADALDLTEYLARKPRALSGGQRQRVSIARALVREPAVLLLDEPLSNLDTELRSRMRHEFARLHQRLGATMIYVTHDQLEAMTLANRIVVMSAGRVEQAGPPMDLYRRPATLTVARAIGSPGINLLPAQVIGSDAREAHLRLADGGNITASVRWPILPGAVTLGIRPEHLHMDSDGPLGGAIELFERLGPLSFAHLGGNSQTIVAQLPGDRTISLGERMCFSVDPADALLFDAEDRLIP